MRTPRFLWLLLPIIVLLLAGCPKTVAVTPPAPTPNADHSIMLTWQQSFANNGACSSTITTSCISGFNEGYITGTTLTQLHTDTAAVCTGTTQPENCASTFNGILPIGSVTFYVSTTYVDQNGAAGVVGPTSALTPNQVAADTAVNVKGTILN